MKKLLLSIGKAAANANKKPIKGKKTNARPR